MRWLQHFCAHLWKQVQIMAKVFKCLSYQCIFQSAFSQINDIVLSQTLLCASSNLKSKCIWFAPFNNMHVSSSNNVWIRLQEPAFPISTLLDSNQWLFAISLASHLKFCGCRSQLPICTNRIRFKFRNSDRRIKIWRTRPQLSSQIPTFVHTHSIGSFENIEKGTRFIVHIQNQRKEHGIVAKSSIWNHWS